MKKYFVLSSLIGLMASISGITSANSEIPAKQLEVPFVQQVINTSDYKGLAVTYNMDNNPNQKVVCSFSNIYKAWMNYSENGAAKESGTYGNTQTVILTSKGKTGYVSETLDQFHADANGQILIHHIDQNQFPKALVSCFYMPDETL